MIEQMVLVNERFMAQHPVAGDSIRINGVRPSNIWTRSVYMEGLLALNEVAPQPRYVEYAMDWAVANLWGFRGGSHTRNADTNVARRFILICIACMKMPRFWGIRNVCSITW